MIQMVLQTAIVVKPRQRLLMLKKKRTARHDDDSLSWKSPRQYGTVSHFTVA